MSQWNAFPTDGVVADSGGRIVASGLKDGEPNLIAAAPDMLAALEALKVQLNSMMPDFAQAHKTLDQAIAKARGEP